MGMNLRSCCHSCEVQVFHYRGEENKTLLPFYRKHYDCMLKDKSNIETLEDQIQEAEWMNKYEETNSEGYYPLNK